MFMATIVPGLLKAHCSTVLMEMAKSQPLTNIRVKDFIAEAGIARQTFYNHFRDIDDLICYTAATPFLSDSRPFYGFSDEECAASLQYVREHRAFFCQLAEHTGPHAYRRVTVRDLERRGRELYIDDNLPEGERLYRQTALLHKSAGDMDTYLDWVSSGMTTPIEILIRIEHETMPRFILEVGRDRPWPLAAYPH